MIHTRFVRLFLLLLMVPRLEARETNQSPAPQSFEQEISVKDHSFPGQRTGAFPTLMHVDSQGRVWLYKDGWHTRSGSDWKIWEKPQTADDILFLPWIGENAYKLPLPLKNVQQVLGDGRTVYVAVVDAVYRISGRELVPLPRLNVGKIHQIALGKDGALHAATDSGLLRLVGQTWEREVVLDSLGRNWAAGEIRGVACGPEGTLWAATTAGVARRDHQGWRFFEAADGVPWTDFTWVESGVSGDAWFGTRLGIVYFDGREWHYRQGKRWLIHDHVRQISVDGKRTAWILTAGGLCAITREPFTLHRKAAYYESEVEKYIKRTPYGFVAEAALRKPGDRQSADPQDSDNDGLWTAMYGAGECFAYAALKTPEHHRRAREAFEALKFLQDVTRGGTNTPPDGFVARTIRPLEWPDPNQGRLERDKMEQKQDRLWKVYEPRWPRSADRKWYWKSDTSSDELDGHYFFYPLYYEFCADTAAEKERVRTVVRALTDHLIEHDFALVDHDGTPTRWGIYGPDELNRNPDWWQERGLKSLSMLSYLAVASYVTGDSKYERISRHLADREGYAHNAMHPKVQHGPGSGNQSDDEMAFMCYYNLLRYSKDENLKALIRVSFYRYWLNEAPEMNPFFNFAYAAHGLSASGHTPFGTFTLAPAENWLADSLKTLRGFPLDRLNWGHRNQHRADVVPLSRVQSGDVTSPDPPGTRGHRVNGKVLPVENRHFSHWNTDPWRLDYAGEADELSAGTVFLLPYYMGLYHGYIDKPIPASQSAAKPQSSSAHE